MTASRSPNRRSTRRALRPLQVVLLCAVMVATSVVFAAPASAAQAGARQAPFDTAILHLVNKARASRGVPALQSDGGLTSLAAWWSRKMANGATGGQLKHNPNAWDMLADYGASNRTAWAENVAKFGGGVAARALFDAYMASPGHRANILSARYRYVGIGTVSGPHGTFNAMEFTDRVEPGGCHPFLDVNGSSGHCGNIGWLSRQKITDPSGGNYHPFRAVSRQAIAAFLYRFTHDNRRAPDCRTRPFRDVPVTNQFCGAIAWMAKTGISTGYRDGTFRPTRSVSRAAMAAYLYRTVKDRMAPRCSSSPFADVPARDTFCGAITWMKSAGIASRSSTRFHPGSAVTRQAMATFLHRTAPLQ